MKLLEGGRLDPNSGVEGGCDGRVPAGEAARYTGVQDNDDVLESGRFYDPDAPSGDFKAWPRYPGLMDRAQQPFRAAGLRRPSYVAFGNHDGTVQGNFHALKSLDDIARGCVKAVGFGRETLAALAREFSFNDPQVGGEAKAEGRAIDRNVELLLRDPRR